MPSFYIINTHNTPYTTPQTFSAEIGHVGSFSRTVYGEEAKSCGGYVVELAVAMGKEFVALLGGRIKAHGIVHTVVSAEGYLLETQHQIGADEAG